MVRTTTVATSGCAHCFCRQTTDGRACCCKCATPASGGGGLLRGVPGVVIK